MDSVHEPRLWFTPSDVARVRDRVRAGEPTAAAIAALARETAAQPLEDALAALTAAERPGRTAAGDYPVACAVTHLLTGDPAPAARAADYLLAWTARRQGELGRGSFALHAAVAHECCYNAWDEARRLAVTERLCRLAESFYYIDTACGDPHVVTNNHWAVAHAGAALAAMAAHGHPRAPGGAPCDLSEWIDWARGRMRPFLMHHGDRGLYHEGLGYQIYPASFWLPMAIASANFDGRDFLAEMPNLRQMGASLYAAVAARPAFSNTGDAGGSGFGSKLTWNDDGPGWTGANPAVLMVHIAPRAQRGALRWLYDRLSGVHGDRRFAPGWCGWFFSLLFYPYDEPATDPNGVLPRHLTDGRQGLSFFRNRYRDGDDAVLGCYAKSTFVGGHQQDDAGSIRLMALGHDWIVGGGQARGKAEFQSVLTPADGSREQRPMQRAAIICDEETETGGVFGMDVRLACHAYAERWVAVDYSGACGAPVALALLDQVDDHLGRDWHWNLSFAPGLSFAADADGLGFVLRAADGASLSARFLHCAPDAIALPRMPDSQRTYQGGTNPVVYPGGPYVQARFTFLPNLGVYVVMTVQRGAPPPVEALNGLAVRIGGREWRRPFGPAVPAAFRVGVSGILCRYPSGDRDWVAPLLR